MFNMEANCCFCHLAHIKNEKVCRNRNEQQTILSLVDLEANLQNLNLLDPMNDISIGQLAISSDLGLYVALLLSYNEKNGTVVVA